MKCPHCLVEFHDNPDIISLGKRNEDRDDGFLAIEKMICSKCNNSILFLINHKNHNLHNAFGNRLAAQQIKSNTILSKNKVYPKGASRPPVPPEVIKETKSVGEDYTEACLVLEDSPKASAALSRRCLQSILREKAGVKHGNLAGEIQEVIDSKIVPSDVVEMIDTVRHIGNFSAHANKSTSTGSIIEVEPDEAEWNLDVIETLFEYYYIRPAKTAAKRTAIKKKLADSTGKGKLK